MDVRSPMINNRITFSRQLLGNNLWRSGCNVCTKDPENFDEEVKSLVTACRVTSESSNRPWKIPLAVIMLKEMSGEAVNDLWL